jgi:hypothetical protein
MSTFETVLHPAMDLTSMRQLGNVRTRTVQVNPESGTTFTLSGTQNQDIFFSLPQGGSSTMINGMNSYLCYDIVFDCGAAEYVGFSNGDANSVVRSLETTVSGTTVEQIERYNVLSAIFSDFKSVDKARNLDSILQGGTLQSASSSKQPREFADQAYTRVAVPIYSAFYGVLTQGQYAVSTDGIRMRFTLEAPDTALISGGGGTLGYVLTNVSLKLEYVDVEPAVFQQLVEEGGGVLKTHGIGVANFNTTLTAQSTSNSVLIPARKSAVKHIWNCLRPSANLTASNRNSTGGRLSPNARQLYWTIAGKQYPQIPIRVSNAAGTAFAGGEVMAEMLKTMRNLHSNTGDTVFDAVAYLDNVGALETSAFVFGYNWDTDADPMTISGIDTNSSNIYLQIDSSTSSAGAPTASIGIPVASTLDSFVFYDAILTTDIATGQVSIVQ